MAISLHQVDAFTDRAYGGNPAAVVLLEAPTGDEAWMQTVAAEMNLSETAFATPRGDGELDLRWFTPTVEVDLCGHATLATAHVLHETGRLAPGDTARFHTRSGALAARVLEGGSVELDLPARPPRTATPPVGADALGAPEASAFLDTGDHYVAVVDTIEDVLATTPRFADLARVADRIWIVTAPAGADDHADFVSRTFGPRYGIDEDPVTGSSHCALGPYWAQRLGRTTVTGRQISARGGIVGVRTAGDRVALVGDAVTVVRGELLSAPTASAASV